MSNPTIEQKKEKERKEKKEGIDRKKVISNNFSTVHNFFDKFLSKRSDRVEQEDKNLIHLPTDSPYYTSRNIEKTEKTPVWNVFPINSSNTLLSSSNSTNPVSLKHRRTSSSNLNGPVKLEPKSSTVVTPTSPLLQEVRDEDSPSFDFEQAKSETTRIWKKDLQSLPVAVDLIRLASVITVKETRSINRVPSLLIAPPKEQEEEVTAVQVLHIISQLTSLLNTPEESERICKAYPKYVNIDFGEFGSKKIQLFLQEVVGVENPVVKVLKACNQSIIAPVIIQLRIKFCNELVFKDHGGWRIYIFIKKTEIEVIHRKKQVQHRTDGKPADFEFEWELSIRFNFEMTNLIGLNFRVRKLIFREAVDEKLRHKALIVFAKILTQNGMMSPISRVPLNTQIPPSPNQNDSYSSNGSVIPESESNIVTEF